MVQIPLDFPFMDYLHIYVRTYLRHIYIYVRRLFTSYHWAQVFAYSERAWIVVLTHYFTHSIKLLRRTVAAITIAIAILHHKDRGKFKLNFTYDYWKFQGYETGFEPTILCLRYHRPNH